MLSPAVLQFGTGRFLLAHVDLFVSEALAAGLTLTQAMHDAALRTDLVALWAEEIVPVFAAVGQHKAAQRYLVTLRERRDVDRRQRMSRRRQHLTAAAPLKCAVRQLLSTGGGVLEHRHGRPGAGLDRVDGKTRTFELELSSGTPIDQTRRLLWTGQ